MDLLWHAANELLQAELGAAMAGCRKSCFLQALPEELLRKICEETVGPPWERDTATLANIARTCRLLNRVAIPLLYRDIRRGLPWGNMNQLDAMSKDVGLFLSLCSNQALGPAIRSMELASTIGFPWMQCHLPPSIKQAYHAAMEQMFGLQPGLEGYYDNPIPFLALAYSAPRLKKLTLALGAGWGAIGTDFLLDKVKGRPATPKFTLPELTDLTIHYEKARLTSQLGASLNKLNDLLYTTPRLETLAIDFARSGTSLTARLPHLTSIKLAESNLCATALSNLTRACHNLVHFELTHDRGTWRPERSLPVSPAQVLDCLARAKNTLQRLYIATWIPAPGLVLDKFPLIHRLGTFPALEKVAVDYRAMTRDQSSFDTLAELLQGLENLEEVFIFGVEGSARFKKEFGRLMDAVRLGEWPRLRKVTLQTLGYHDAATTEAAWQRLASYLPNMTVHGSVGEEVVAGVRIKALAGSVATANLGFDLEGLGYD